MRLTILGCAGSVPGPGQATSGYLVEAEGFLLGLEFGTGVHSRLQEEGHSPFDLDALLFSHLHHDHCADFTPLTVSRRYRPNPPYDTRSRRLPVYAPLEAPTRFANAYAIDESERMKTDLSDVYEFYALEEHTIPIGPFAVTAYRMRHVGEAFGFRISHQGRTLAFTGDTAVCPALDVLAKDVDLLLAEASWTDSPERPPGLHLSGKEAGIVAREAKVDRLLLTHVISWYDSAAVLTEARAEFPETELVQQGARYEL